MIMIRAIIRPEKCDEVLAALMEAGFPAVTKMDVYGRGKQRGMRVGEVTYDELPKEMILTVVKEADKDFVVTSIMKTARTRRRAPSATARFRLPGGRGVHRSLRRPGRRGADGRAESAERPRPSS